MRIVFFGTPAFAVPSLDALLDEGAKVVGVVTQPDRPRGRSRSTLVSPPVKVAALSHDIPVLQPDHPRGDLFVAALQRLDPALGVVVAYGHILRPEILRIPPLGMLNVHASLLPRHRGAAPIQHAILAGDTETGISIMQMDRGMDTGPVLQRFPVPILGDDTAATLTDRLAQLGGTALVETLALLQLNQVVPEPQDSRRATDAPKIGRAEARIPWTMPAEVVHRHIRAFDPDPGAWTHLGQDIVKVFRPRLWAEGAEPLLPGRMRIGPHGLLVGTGTFPIVIEEIQPAGKRRMGVSAWLRGHADTAREDAFV